MLRDDLDEAIGQPMIDFVRETYRGRMRLGDGDFDSDACAIVQICDELDRTRRRRWHRENELRAALLGNCQQCADESPEIMATGVTSDPLGSRFES